MKFLFVATVLGELGGLETLIARMSTWLIAGGHEVTLLSNARRGPLSPYPSALELITPDTGTAALCHPHALRRARRELRIPDPDVIKAFDLPASWISTLLSASANHPARVLYGNYFPYQVPTGWNIFTRTSARLFFLNLRLNLPDACVLCMSQEQVLEYQRAYGAKRKPRFWPIPVGSPSVDTESRRFDWGQLVSVGRLAPMKEYNFYMLDVVSKLRHRGYPVTWAAYGDGPFRAELSRRIDALGLAGHVSLRGAVPNDRFGDAVARAHAFVGMGTSAVEAALHGVPSIVALAHDTSGATYGPLYRMPFGNVGEMTSVPPNSRVEDEIVAILHMNDAEYKAEARRHVSYAQQYGIGPSMSAFTQIADNAPRCRPNSAIFSLYHAYHVATLLRASARR